MKKLIVISDWASDSLPSQEVRSAVEGFLKDATTPNISFVSSTPSTIHTAFLLSQVVRIEERYGRPLESVIFQNTDPRLQSETGVDEAQGASFVVIRLISGMYLCGPNAGYDFSLIKDEIEQVYEYKDLDKGSQFRSRDLYSRVCAHLMDAMEDELDLEEIHTNVIPELRGFYVGHIDNFGNIKTTITIEDLKGKVEIGEEVTLRIHEKEQKVMYVSNMFAGTPGQLVMYPGSSGHRDNPYIEITVWRHFIDQQDETGVHAFDNPRPGSEIYIMK